MNEKYQLLVKILGKNRVLQNENLGKYSSFKLGGPADLFIKTNTIPEIIQAVRTAFQLHIPFFILGGGTNLLISEKGFRGLVIKNEAARIRILGWRRRKISRIQTNEIFLEAESGATMNRLVRFTLDQGLKGLEAFLGQPGTVGGAVYINAHNLKKKKFFGERVIGARILTPTGEEKKVNGDYFNFKYDKSIIQKTKEIVLSVILSLEQGNKEKLWKEASEVLTYRHLSQPQGVYSVGCIFRNLKKSEAKKIQTPDFTTSAGFLLEAVGLKGCKIGQAWFSSEHANFIVHQGKASVSDVLKLIKLAKEKVKKKFNIDLEEEIIFVGEF